jgi:cytochrome oxidase assembly protein ShyY1
MMKQKIVLSLVFIPIIIIGICLSMWQYQRSLWKEALLSDYAQKLSQEPTPIATVIMRTKGDKNSILGNNNDLFKNFELIPTKITGHFVADLVFYRPVHNGLNIIVAFETADGIIPVNAGTIPHTAKDFPLEKILPIDNKEITITGFYRLPQTYTGKVPHNKALVAQIPFEAFYEYYTQKLLVGAVQIDTKTPLSPSLTGHSGDDFIQNIPNNHKQYMGTWLLLSVVALVIYVMLLIRRGI